MQNALRGFLLLEAEAGVNKIATGLPYLERKCKRNVIAFLR